jgi:hypothetical protein
MLRRCAKVLLAALGGRYSTVARQDDENATLLIVGSASPPRRVGWLILNRSRWAQDSSPLWAVDNPTGCSAPPAVVEALGSIPVPPVACHLIS